MGLGPKLICTQFQLGKVIPINYVWSRNEHFMARRTRIVKMNVAECERSLQAKNEPGKSNCH